jgi:hypothetical protein
VILVSIFMKKDLLRLKWGPQWIYIFLESEGIVKMIFPHFKHTSSVLINLVLFLKEFSGDCRVTANHSSMQFKILFIDRVISHSGLWFVLFGHLLIENCLKTYLDCFYDPFLILMHKTNSFKIFLLGKGFKCCEIIQFFLKKGSLHEEFMTKLYFY